MQVASYRTLSKLLYTFLNQNLRLKNILRNKISY